MLHDVMTDFSEFQPLVAAGMTMQLSMASGSERKDGTRNPALKCHGVPAHGIAMRYKLQDRVHGSKDVKITLDNDYWEMATEDERKALLFHELYHFDLKLDDAGDVKLDDIGRSEVTLRHHDYDFGWFMVAAKHFGKASAECQQFRTMVEQNGQLLLPSVFANPSLASGDESAEVHHNGDTLTILHGEEQVTIPAEDLARVHAEESKQLAEAGKE